MVGGHFRYYGVPMNNPALTAFRFQVGWHWYRTLSRRSQKGRIPLDRLRRLVARWLPASGACLSSLSSAPHGRRHHLRQEPDAGIPLVRIRGGGCE